MADCLVALVVEKITVLLEEKVNLLVGVEQEVEFIRDELERMVAFLRVADAMEEKDEELKVWVKQVRDAAYDMEVILDQFILHHTHDDRYGLINCIGIGRLKKTGARLAMASEIQSLKSRVIMISERHRRYGFAVNVPDRVLSTRVSMDCRGDALLLEEGELVGIDGPKREVISSVLEAGCGLKVVSIVGMGGLGKTTLAKKVFDDAAVRKHFHSHAWITVSESFKIEDVLKDLVQQLFEQVKQPLPEGLNTMNCIRLKGVAKDFLLQRRYILVFDDVWSISAWKSIHLVLPNENNGSRVILTTRLNDVASYSTQGYKYELKPLSEKESWTLFCRRTFQATSACPSHLEEISKNVLRKCGGLPLAIVAVSGVLASKKNIEEWQMFNRTLGLELEGNDKLESIRAILQISFNELPYYLKPCLLYLSIFPEDHLIEHNTLIRLWIAEGFVKGREGRTLEEVAQGYLNELINRSLIRSVHNNDDGSLKLGHLHDFYREIAVAKSRDNNFVTTINQHTSTWPNKARCLSIHGKLGDARNNKRYIARLHSLLTFGVEDPLSTSRLLKLLSRCNMVNVLDLRGVPLEIFPKQILNLLHLKYLSLRNTRIKLIPRSIKKLQNLEVLDLKQALITELPVEILKLNRLRQLLVYCHAPYSYLPFDQLTGFKPPIGIGALLRLQKLSFVELNHESGIIRELGMLIDLRRLSVTKLTTQDGKALCSSIQNLQSLRSLGIRSIGKHETIDLTHMSLPPPFLQRLYLKGRLENVPRWIQSLHGLVKIYFQWSRLKEDPLQYLQDLPSLVHLEFLEGYIGEMLHFKAGKFDKLKLLDLDRIQELRYVTIDKDALPLLEKLVIQRCSLMERVPVGIECLGNLKFLEFFDMPDEFVSTFLPPGVDYCRVQHIPEVYYTYSKDGCWIVYSLDDKCFNENCNKSAITTYGRRNWL